MRVSLIGSGNVSTVLAKKINAAGHVVIEIVERGFHPVLDADLYIIAITDTALAEIYKWLSLKNKLVVHTAGSVSKKVLSKVSKNYGVLYPLQSLRKEMHHIPEIPFLVDGNTPDNTALIKDFADSISQQVRLANDDERLKMHLAAVLVNNFVNHLYTIAEDFCVREQLDFSLLQPLITETANRIGQGSAAGMQTGPAVRKDEPTIKKHLSMLKDHKQLKKLYKELSHSISHFTPSV